MPEPRPKPPRSGRPERLTIRSGVNDCKVSPELRGDKTRPADCGKKAKAAAQDGEADATQENGN